MGLVGKIRKQHFFNLIDSRVRDWPYLILLQKNIWNKSTLSTPILLLLPPRSPLPPQSNVVFTILYQRPHFNIIMVIIIILFYEMSIGPLF